MKERDSGQTNEQVSGTVSEIVSRSANSRMREGFDVLVIVRKRVNER